MFTLRTLTATLLVATTLAITASTTLFAPAASAQSAEDLDVLRVDLPLNKQSFRNGELEISQLIAENTYIDVEEFNLRAVELEAHTTRNGEVRLKVGRYVTPPVPLPNENETGLLRIEAPHKANNNWRLLIEDRVTISSLTAVLEPRHDNPDYYHSRYEQRGYTFGSDPYLRSDWRRQSGVDNWPYSWLRNDYDYNRRASHWLWLNDRRSRFLLNPSFGFSHRHTRDCYDRFGRHLTFGGQLRRPDARSRIRNSLRYSEQRSRRTRNYLYERPQNDRKHSTRRAPDRQNNAGRIIERRSPVQSSNRIPRRATTDRAAKIQRARPQRAQQQRTQQQRTYIHRPNSGQRSDDRRREPSDRRSTRRDSGPQGNRRGDN